MYHTKTKLPTVYLINRLFIYFLSSSKETLIYASVITTIEERSSAHSSLTAIHFVISLKHIAIVFTFIYSSSTLIVFSVFNDRHGVFRS